MRQKALNAYKKKGSIGFKHHADVRRNPWKQSKIYNSKFYYDVTAFLQILNKKQMILNEQDRKELLVSLYMKPAAHWIALHRHQIWDN